MYMYIPIIDNFFPISSLQELYPSLYTHFLAVVRTQSIYIYTYMYMYVYMDVHNVYCYRINCSLFVCLFVCLCVQEFQTSMYASPWFLTMFASVLSLNVVFRIMDIFLVEVYTLIPPISPT